MRGRSRQPTALELALWHGAVRDVVRRAELPGPAPAIAPSAAEPGPPAPPAAGAVAAPSASVPVRRRDPAPPPTPSPLDRRTLRRLERGLYPASARLDLHGMDQDAAHRALAGFLAHAQGRGHRCVLVITGRGERSGGVLRRSVPRWLREAPTAARVLGWAEAGRAHGGEGALYVLLRRVAARPSPPGAAALADRVPPRPGSRSGPRGRPG
jgi:DNA-nicking Smr family endonuclease